MIKLSKKFHKECEKIGGRLYHSCWKNACLNLNQIICWWSKSKIDADAVNLKTKDTWTAIKKGQFTS